MSRLFVKPGTRLLWWLPGSAATALILLLSLGPLAALLWQAGGLAPRTLLADPYLRHVLGFSLWQALLSTLLSLGLAIPVARALARRRFPGRTLLIKLFGLSLVLPVIIAVFGIVAVHGKQGWLPQLLHGFGLAPGNYLYGLFGILLAHVFFNMPLAARLLLQSLESIPESSWRLASQLGMRSSHIFRLLEWPLIRAQLPGLASLIFMLCFTSFATVLALGGGPKSTTLEVAVYQALRFDFDLATAGGLALVQLILTAALLMLQHKLQSSPASRITSHRPCLRPDRHQPGSGLVDALALAIGLAVFLPPLLAIVVAGLNPGLPDALTSGKLWLASGQSLLIALAAGSLATLLGSALLLTSRHLRVREHKRRAATLWETSGSVILMIPAVVLSTGLFILCMPFADVFALGPWLVVLVNALMALPYVLRTLSAPMQLVVRQYDRLADSLGVHGLHRLRLVEWPLLRRPLGQAAALAMILSLGDLGAIAMFGSQELTTLPWLLYQQLGSYRLTEAAATALLLLTLCFSLFWLVERGLGGKHADH
ncbi:thiamine/thiamine pyrophosphate ABC transporter permease [Aeromonas dhakensis]|uniref:thiamine/thiamine pyrophosphate ABC transporter permease n=1 Tax=Aeromonas dhakensis TaxID=196024 RepID=UPI001116E586|nr:thiamine/thiamine pyrophosphate ABC transporter permease [Aeromonas dhakensis]MBL0534295.1 thiamine/thiamine pyrophosphate ABC transporter permease [Aeromonas dhakensis]MDH0347237.1 thiamine/thiamine pyrophosphate ABC transporter permease [Aeromonas dhakensis]TNI31766.1 thiamine/thiamine pyrophosphate ABC transporter, permease protein [Aeromonas dhakensis]TNI47276.1 thiamine/thiamine pyrophosphate ABC transporter, permease protein [Aeromonas dhakensis]HDT5888004.1 thiamine/thiamine pyrophos